ncbi:MAG: DUF5046 domain-containing protein [Oscillospiraceae bacterium]|nr:DUF5046 domain-containing protein [Oscillospiraceae bacterium]
MKKLIWILALLLLAGCSRGETEPLNTPLPEQPPVEQPSGNVYLYMDDNRYLAVDDGGNVVMEVTDGQLSILRRDEKIIGYAVKRSDGIVTDEYGWAQPEKTWNDLYDENFEFLYSLPLSYVALEHDLISGWNPNTGTSQVYRLSDGTLLYDDIYAFYELGEYCYVNQDDWNAPGMFLDGQGNTIAQVPQDCTTGGSVLDQYMVVIKNELHGLIAPDGTLALPFAYHELRSGQLGCVFARDDSGWHAIEVSTGKEVFSSPTPILKLFSETAIVEDESGDAYQMVDYSGNALMDERFIWVNSYDTDDDGTPELLEAPLYEQDGNILFSPDGTVLYLSNTESSYMVMDENTVVLTIIPQNSVDDPSGYLRYLLDPISGTQTLLPETSADAFYSPLYTEFGREHGLISRGGSNELGWYRTDILDTDGTVLLEGLQDMIYRGDGVFQCSRGFTSGLLRLDGTWLYEESSFSSLTDN